MAYDVFISHSSKDKPLADAVCAALEREGIRCWIAPRDVLPGKEWGEAIVEAIRQARVVLLLFTANANASSQIKREVECAVSHEVTIVPLRLEQIEPTQSFEYFLGNIHWLDAWTPPLETHLCMVVEKLNAILQRAPTKPKGAPTPSARLLRRRPVIAVVLAVILLSILGASYWWTHRSTLDPGLIGTWEYRMQIVGRDFHLRYRIEANGKYERMQFIDERGTYQAGDDKWQARVSASGRVDEGTYVMPNADTLTLTTKFLNLTLSTTYNRTRRGSPQIQFEGAWQASNVQFAECSWECTLEYNSDQTYHFRMEATDAGTMKARDGEWEASSLWKWKDPTMPRGKYRIKTKDTIAMDLPPFPMGELVRVSD